MNTPLYPGSQYPDAIKPISMTLGGERRVMDMLNGEPIHNVNPYNAVDMTSPFLSQHLSDNDFEPTRRVITNVLENTDIGWEFYAAKPRQMKYNQVIDRLVFPKTYMPRLPSDVPAPVLTYEREQARVQMDEYSLQFQMEGQYLVHAGREADVIYTNFILSLISSMNSTWRLKIKFSFMNAKQDMWLKYYRNPDAKRMAEINAFELQTYALLDKDEKGLPNMINFARQLTKMQNFEFNTLVVPFGKLDDIAAKAYYTEASRSGAAALSTLFGGGKKLAQLVEGMAVFEDSKDTSKNTRNVAEEAFVETVTRGGFIDNLGNADCDYDDDPNCAYGFLYIAKGSRNWETKKLLDLIRESGRYSADGNLDPFIYTLCEDWQKYCAAMQVFPVEGRLDPMAYRVSNEVLSDPKVMTTYLPTIRFGEQDPAYSPLEVVRKHAMRVATIIRKTLTESELKAISKLDLYRKTFSDSNSIGEAQEAFLAAVSIGNTTEVYTLNGANGGLDQNTDNLSVFLERDPFNMAPKNIPLITDIVQPIHPRFVRTGQTKALGVMINSKLHYIYTIKYDVAQTTPVGGNTGYARGREGTAFAYVALPYDYPLTDNANYTRISGTVAALALAMGPPGVGGAAGGAGAYGGTLDDAVNLATTEQALGLPAVPGNFNAVGSVTQAGPWVATSMPVIHDTFEANQRPVTEDQLKWAFRPTYDIHVARVNANAGRLGASNALYAGAGVPTQGFTLQLAPIPTHPYFYSRISCLRNLASLHTYPGAKGWNEVMVREIADGVKALDNLFGIFLNIYTKNNMYFDPNYVPYDIKMNDNELDGLNNAISHLWGENDNPFLIRRAMRMKSSGGNWVFPRNFVDYRQNARNTDILTAAAQLRRLGFAQITDNAVTTAMGGWAPSTGAQKLAYAASVSWNVIVDSGIFTGKVKDVLNDNAKFTAFANAFEASTASSTYVEYLRQYHAPELALIPAANRRNLATFIGREIAPELLAAFAAMSDYISACVAAGNTGINPSQQQITQFTSNAYTAVYMLSTIVSLWLDIPSMEYSIGRGWLEEMKLRTQTPGALISSTKGKNGYEVIKDSFLKNTETLRKRLIPGADTVQGTISGTSGRYWVNSGLSVSPNVWKTFDNELLSASRRVEAGVAGANIDLYQTFCLPMRPMKGGDYGNAIAGQPLWEGKILVPGVAPAGVAINNYMKDIREDMSQAMVRKGGAQMDRTAPKEPGYLRTQSLYSRRGDVEALARGISGSVYEQTSKKVVPVEFMDPKRHDPFGRAIRGDSYPARIQYETRTGLTIDIAKEPQFMKWRLENINEYFKNLPIERAAASLWCFSPFKFDVISNMIEKKITPAGVGFVWMRPFQKDNMGRVLFTVADESVAASGYNYVFSQSASNMQHDKVNVKLSAFLGCVIYDPSKILWLKAQTMHGNVSGMGGEAFIGHRDFDPSKVHSPSKDAFVIYVGDNLKRTQIRDCISITSRYNTERYIPLISQRSLLDTEEQHLPGLIYTIAKMELYKLNSMIYNSTGSFWEQRATHSINTDCWREDSMDWNSARRGFTEPVIGNWHLSGLTPDDAQFLERGSVSMLKRRPFSQMKF